MNADSLKSINEIDYKYWIDWWNKWPSQNSDVNGVNLRPKEYKVKKLVEQIEKAVPLKKKMKVLDVGCGNGEVMKHLAPKVDHIFGIDRSEQIIEAAKKNLTGVKNSSLRVMDAIDITYEKNSFDLTYSAAVIQYIDKYHIGKYVQDMLFCTKEGGYVLIVDVLPASKKHDGSNCTQIDGVFWGNVGTGQTHWDNATLKAIIPSTYEDRYHVLLQKNELQNKETKTK